MPRQRKRAARLEANHTGPHREPEQGEEWASGKLVVLRHDGLIERTT
jgi:hypothetical protein